MFSYLTAYSFFGRPERTSEENWNVLIDSFRSKSTIAWSELTNRVTPKIYIRGDESNAFICFADLVAFLTDCKLYSKRLKLMGESLATIYKDYPFEVAVHWFDQRMLSKIKWNDDIQIDFSQYLAKPIIYVLIDPVEKYFLTEINTSKLQEPAKVAAPAEGEMRPEKFREIVEKSEVFDAVLRIAYKKGGCAKVYTNDDQKLVRDGDILVYIGNKAKDAAQTLEHMYDVRVLSGKEARHEAFPN